MSALCAAFLGDAAHDRDVVGRGCQDVPGAPVERAIDVRDQPPDRAGARDDLAVDNAVLAWCGWLVKSTSCRRLTADGCRLPAGAGSMTARYRIRHQESCSTTTHVKHWLFARNIERIRMTWAAQLAERLPRSPGGVPDAVLQSEG